MLLHNQIYNGDCLELMPKLDDKSIDMILCDLPYGITGLKWDSIIPLQELWNQYKRIIKDNGVIVLTGSQPFTSKLVMSNPKWFRCEWIWQKDNGTNFGNIKFQPFKVHENILIFSKKKNVYNPQYTFGHKYYTKSVSSITTSSFKTKRIDTINDTGSRYPISIQKFSGINTLPKERGLHPTQKPIALFEYFIKTYSNEGDLVLDNCAGSGTTAIAAINTNRQYILMEKDENYFNVAQNRILQHTPQLILNLE